MSKETVLVVDDGEENREFVVDYILEPNGFASLVAKDGQEGFEMALEYQPDLILLDLQMPRMNGREVLRALSERNIDIPVVLMTFHGSEDIIIEMFRLGVKDYVKKPYTVDEMLNAIDRSLSEARLRKEKDALLERLVNANRELQQRIQELNVLYRLGKTVASNITIEGLLPQVLEAAINITDAQEAHLYLTEDTDLMCRCEKRQNAARPEMVRYPADDAAAQHVLNKGQIIIAAKEQFAGQARQPFSAAYAPLILRGNIIGVLSVSNLSDENGAFTQNDSLLLSALTDYAAIALENSRQSPPIIHPTNNTGAESAPPQVEPTPPQVERLPESRSPVTILFTSVRGQVRWAEKAPHNDVLRIFNECLTTIEHIVTQHGGRMDKVHGYGAMAIFAADDKRTHTYQATSAGLEILQTLRDMYSDHDVITLPYSVGIHTGEAVMGYVGSTPTSQHYTALGEVVSLAKRLQESALQGQILVDEGTVMALEGAAQADKRGELKVRGSKKNITVYEILDLTTR